MNLKIIATACLGCGLVVAALQARTTTTSATLVSAAPAAPVAGTRLAAASAQAAPAQQDYIWWEAESPRATNFPERNPFAPANEQEAAVLSAGRWIGTGSDRNETLFLEYDVTVPRAGKYQLFARKFWQHGPFRWRVDNGAWQTVGRTVALLDEAPIRLHTVANWINAGTVDLTTGRHSLRVELLENAGAAAFDAFLLTAQPFTARGRLKPGEKYNRAPAGWFAFEPDTDTFTATPLDLRHLNEKVAGENGFIGVRGEEFIHQRTGQPVRFWAVNAGGGLVNLPRPSVDYLARHLAKMGVNMVRYHGGVWGSNIREVDRERLDRLFYFVSAMKKEGIYTCLSIYFPLWLHLREQEHGFAGYNGQHPFSLLFFNPEFQSIYRGWWRTLLTTPNPHGGLPFKDDPAVAMLELVNEDSYLFWTFKPYETIPAPQTALLEKQFGDWLARKHGSQDKAFAAWGAARIKGDDATAGRAGFMNLWEVFNKKDRRAADTAAFLTQSQKAFFEQTINYLKRDLGSKSLVYASNWVTADARILGPLDKYSNTVGDFMDRHGYFGGPHQGERASYSLSKGDRYDDRSALLFSPAKAGEGPDYNLPIMDMHYNGMPSTITEINWPTPNRYRADLPLLSAAYGRLQGSDGSFFFALSGPAWQEVLGKFSIQTPVAFGQFPATALIFRRGLVKEADAVADVHLKVADLLSLKGAPVSAPANLDEFRARDIPAGRTAAVDSVASIDPLAFLVGKVGLRFSEQGGQSRIANLPQYIDRTARTVRSQTGELLWDYGKGKVTVSAPQAQGVTGFLAKAGAVRLPDVTIESPMDYGTILVVALDGRPLRQSSRMLLQVMSEDTNYGWEAPGSGLREIKNLGSAPIVVKNLQGRVSLQRPDAAALRVSALDLNGYNPRRVAAGNGITLDDRTMYYLIEKA